jgi:hypothetical protein
MNVDSNGRMVVIVRTIYLHISTDLQVICIILSFNLDGRHVLVFVLAERYLQDEYVRFPIGIIDDPDKIDIAIFVKVEIVDAVSGIVEFSFKLFDCLRFFEQLGNGLKVQSLTGLCCRCDNRDFFVASETIGNED